MPSDKRLTWSDAPLSKSTDLDRRGAMSRSVRAVTRRGVRASARGRTTMLNRVPSVPVGAVSVMAMTEIEVTQHVARSWRRGYGGSIVTVNVDILPSPRRDPRPAAPGGGAPIVVAGGMPGGGGAA